jgi:hypothetical protein
VKKQGMLGEIKASLKKQTEAQAKKQVIVRATAVAQAEREGRALLESYLRGEATSK